MLRTGLAGQDLPAGLNEPGTVCRRFRRWACKGIWDELFLEGLPADALGTVMLELDRLQDAALRERRAGWR